MFCGLARIIVDFMPSFLQPGVFIYLFIVPFKDNLVI